MQAERPEIFELLERQSRWQKSRRDLSWPEKNPSCGESPRGSRKVGSIHA